VQVPYDEGVAIHIGPEPCADVRKGAGEASAGELHRPAIEPRKTYHPGCRHSSETHGRAFSERMDDPAWSQTLACAEASCTGTRRSHGRPTALVTRAALVRIGKARSRSR
jgi:hypothetical protein